MAEGAGGPREEGPDGLPPGFARAFLLNLALPAAAVGVLVAGFPLGLGSAAVLRDNGALGAAWQQATYLSVWAAGTFLLAALFVAWADSVRREVAARARAYAEDYPEEPLVFLLADVARFGAEVPRAFDRLALLAAGLAGALGFALSGEIPPPAYPLATLGLVAARVFFATLLVGAGLGSLAPLRDRLGPSARPGLVVSLVGVSGVLAAFLFAVFGR